MPIVICGCQRQATTDFELSEQIAALEAPIPDQIREILREKCGTPQEPKLLGEPEMDPDHLKRGGAVYQRRCGQCHGATGDGNGPAAQYLAPLPRDYRKGIFKFISGPYGSRPRRADLLRFLRRGAPGTAMPSFDDLSNDDLEAVVDYVLVLTRRGQLEKSLAELADFEGELNDDIAEDAVTEVLATWKPRDPEILMPTTPMPEFNEASIAKGRELFHKSACTKCHGPTGRGGFLGQVEVSPDEWGHKTAAADLTSGMFRGGNRPIDLYRRIHTGIFGSPMPAFASTFADNPDAIWHLVHFISDMGERRRRNEPPPEPPSAEGGSSDDTSPVDTPE